MISCSSASPSASRSRSRGRSRRSRPLAFSTAPFCHDAYASQNQVVIAQALASSPCRANAVSLSSVIEDRSRGSSRRNTAIITATVSAADLPASLAASTNRVLRSLSTSTGRVRLQIKRSPSRCPASLRPAILGPVVDRAPPGDGGARRPGPPPAPPGPPAREQPPELLALPGQGLTTRPQD